MPSTDRRLELRVVSSERSPSGPRAGEATRVLLADPTTLLRRAVARLLALQPDFLVVGEADNGADAVKMAGRLRPDLVVLDAALPVLAGAEAAQVLRERYPEIHVVVLAGACDDADFHRAVRAGVSGYLLKDLAPEQLFEALRAVMRHETPVAPALVTRMLTELRERDRDPAPAGGPQLSFREREIMRLVAQGLSNKEIGARLHITEGTVKTHVHNVLHKLKIENRIQAAAYVVRNGLGGPAQL